MNISKKTNQTSNKLKETNNTCKHCSLKNKVKIHNQTDESEAKKGNLCHCSEEQNLKESCTHCKNDSVIQNEASFSINCEITKNDKSTEKSNSHACIHCNKSKADATEHIKIENEIDGRIHCNSNVAKNDKLISKNHKNGSCLLCSKVNLNENSADSCIENKKDICVNCSLHDKTKSNYQKHKKFADNEECHECENNNAPCCGNHSKDKNSLIKNVITTSISLVFLILGLIHFENVFFNYFNFAWITTILCGVPIFISGFKNLFKGKITSNFLISLAIIASIVLEILRLCGLETGGDHSYIVAAGEIAILMAVGGILEDFIVSRSKKGLQRLISLTPKKATLKTGDTYSEVELTQIKIGDIVLLKPDEIVSVDGIIVLGESSIDTSNLTGESIPIDVKVGDEVFGGTMNKQGMLEIKVTKKVTDMTMQRLAALTLEAEGKKAPISRIADRWAGFIVPIAIISSIIVFFVAKFAFNISYLDAFIRAVTILVVFCPCALALATPTAIAAGIGNASFKGIIVKSGEALEKLAKVDTFCFDKTGTLTMGKVRVIEIIVHETSEKEFLHLVASAEQHSTHPLALSIMEYAISKIRLAKVSKIKTIQGIGLQAEVDEKVIEIKTANKLDLDKEWKTKIYELESKGYTVVAALCDKKFIGLIVFSDEIRSTAKTCIQNLKRANLNCVMLTGDNASSAGLVAKSIGIETVYFSLLPEEKLQKINEQRSCGKRVCMVGDGVNDTLSLVSSDCSIAIGALKSTTAVETADIAIMNNDINNVYRVKKLSKTVVNTIIRNIFISMGINILSVFLSLFGMLTPVSGAIVHNISSLFVVISSAFILLYDKNKKPRTTSVK